MAAFSDEVLNEGANSEVIELSDGHAVVVHLDEFIESKVKPLAEVSDQIKAQLVNTKAEKQLAEQAEKSLKDAKEGKLSASWKSEKSKTRNFTGVDAALVNKAFTMALDDGKPTYQLVDMQSGDQALLRLDGINRDVKAVETEDELQKVSRTKSYNEFKAYYQYQLDNADIDKN